MDFQSISLHIQLTTFNILNQLNKLMVYLGPWFSPIFQANDPKIHIFGSFSIIFGINDAKTSNSIITTNYEFLFE